MNSAPILAIQLCYFSNRGSQLVKDETLVSCTQTQLGQYLTVPITIEEEVSFINKYSLIATVNHSGTLRREHYWPCIKDLHWPCWYLCNDKSVSNVEETYLNNTTSYILFYSKVLLFPGSTRISFCEGVLSFWIFSLSVTTPRIISRHYNPAVLSFVEAMHVGLTNHGLVYQD